jgi:hypothetical protein
MTRPIPIPRSEILARHSEAEAIIADATRSTEDAIAKAKG